MIKETIYYFKNQIIKLKLKRKVKLAYSIIFSEKYNFAEENGFENFRKEFEANIISQIDLLQIYTLINIIFYYQVPIEELENFQKDNEINFLALLNDIRIRNNYDELLNLNLEMEKAKLEVNLQILDIHIKAGKREFSKDEYSFSGLIYRAEKSKKAPTSLKEKAKLRKLTDKLNKINLNSNYTHKKKELK